MVVGVHRLDVRDCGGGLVTVVVEAGMGVDGTGYDAAVAVVAGVIVVVTR